MEHGQQIGESASRDGDAMSRVPPAARIESLEEMEQRLEVELNITMAEFRTEEAETTIYEFSRLLNNKLDTTIADLDLPEDPELADLQQQYNYFSNSFLAITAPKPEKQFTTIHTIGEVKGAETDNQTYKPTLRIELDQKQTPPKAEPEKQPPP